MFISIVANFYKSGRFIPKLLKSVFAQTFTDWELICVIDASPGNDIGVINKYVDKYGMADKVRIICNKVNIGISRSKKVGIDAAQGEYLMFIDGDDFFAPRALEELARPAREHNVDLVNMNYCRYYAPIRKRVDICVPFKDCDYERVMHRDEFFDRCFINFFGGYFIGLPYWAKLYRSSILKALEFDYPASDDTVAEDKWFNMEAFQHINTAYFIHYVGYFWRWGGISSVRIDESWSTLRDLKKHIEYFPYQQQLIERYSYDKAWVPLLYHLKDKFVGTFSQIAKFKPGTGDADKIKVLIKQSIDCDPFRHFASLLPTASDADKPLLEAVASCDADRVYRIMHQQYKATWKLRYAQKLVHKLLYPFR